ncbi:protease HtpX [Oxalobacter sp. OxGP1]|uniref:protease HtpX n=1 Tax=Oxalobacter paeniformigenes TaxID=2946594 RepID=UPI0022B06593|nr:protease HtpX [Oxalobacter paeniformigenes]MCZ4053119.1 protease HtpX [Oxalobacter paeniformigenes]
MKRIFLFLVTNLAVIVVMSVVLSLLGVNRYLYSRGLDLGSLLVFSLVVGFTGSIISLLMSKQMAKWSTGAYVIETPSNGTEQWLLGTVAKLSDAAGIRMPEVAVYEGEPNAFATGAFKNSALVAVSTGLLANMTHEEVEAVLGHEIAHVANGDMVTLTLIQGVLNTFVVFLARVVGFFVDNLLSRNSENNGGRGLGYFVTVIVCEILFGVLASIIVAWFSRYREYRADAGSARLLGSSRPMIHALQRLGHMASGDLPKNMTAMGINGGGAFMSLFATHPPIEKRIEALQTGRV